MNKIVTFGVFVWIIGQFLRVLKWTITRPALRYSVLFVVLFALLHFNNADSETLTGVTGILAIVLVARLSRNREKGPSR